MYLMLSQMASHNFFLSKWDTVVPEKRCLTGFTEHKVAYYQLLQVSLPPPHSTDLFKKTRKKVMQ